MRVYGLVLALLALPAGAATGRTDIGLTVVPAGGEQALKYGGVLLSRPFGAQLVDGLSIVGRYGTPRERLYIVQGSSGASCPARYIVVAARKGQPPSVSTPFGTCGVGISARQGSDGLRILVSPGPSGTGSARYLFAQGTIRSLDQAAAPVEALATVQTVRCRNPSDMAGLDGDAFRDEFDRTLPTEYRVSSGVRRAEIAPAELRDMVAGLACLATSPGNGKRIGRAAAPLFASKRYGSDAFAALDRIAAASNSDPGLRASARSFAADMHYFVGRREPL